MAISQGVAKKSIWKRQAAKGTLATTSGAQVLRRETSTFELAKETYTTESEINSAQQLVSNRHGVKTVNGAVSAIFSPGTYSDQVAAILRRDFAAVTATTGASITIAGSGPTWTVTRAAGSYLTDGYKIGMVVRLSAGAFNAANLNKNLLITALTATVATVMPVNGVALVAEGPIASSTVTATGKVTYTPATGHTNIYYTVEEWYPDVPASERNQDVKINTLDLSLPGSGNAKLSMNAVGLDQSASASAYFVTPTDESTSQVFVGASGLLLVNGAAQAVITDLSIKIDGKEQPANGVVGSTIRPDIFRGKVMVTGSFTAYFDGTSIADLFRNETATSLVSVLTVDGTANSDFVSIVIPKLDLNSSTPDDGEKGLLRTFSFVAEYSAAGGAGTSSEQTTLLMQDSLA